jgi:hypothetical protein
MILEIVIALCIFELLKGMGRMALRAFDTATGYKSEKNV